MDFSGLLRGLFWVSLIYFRNCLAFVWMNYLCIRYNVEEICVVEKEVGEQSVSMSHEGFMAKKICEILVFDFGGTL